VLMRTYFESISDSLEESAKIDGANDWIVLLKIYLPLSVPALMTISLYYFVDRWNAYFWAMVIIRDEWKVPLQVLLKKLIVQTQLESDMIDMSANLTNQQTIIYATIMIATIPMIAVYPFVQKFFVKGIMIGAVKG
jgi:putative aldouronate transport system permease protein